MSDKKSDAVVDLEAGMTAGEATPLLSSNEPAPLQDMKAESLKEKTVAGVAVVGFFTSLFSLIFQATTHPTVFVSGILGCVLSPYAAIQQEKITQVEALDQTNERMEEEVEQLTQENKRLATQVKEMEETVLNLQAMEETLESLQAMQGQSVDELEKQLKESEEILARMHTNYRTELLQNLITVILAADANGDMMLSDEEIDDIIHNLEGIHGVELKEDLLRSTIIQQGRSLPGVMEVARHLLCDKDIPADKNIFSYIESD